MKKRLVLITCILWVVIILLLLPNLFKSQKYIVSFDSNGGSEVKSIKVKSGSTISKPEDPIKEGYEFIGWMIGDELFDFNTKITKNTQLLANWNEDLNKISFTVIFNTDGGNEIESQVVEQGKTVEKPNVPIKEGYEFIGWFVDNKEYNFNDIVLDNLVIEAKWSEIDNSKSSIKRYTVSFDTDGGSNIKSLVIESGNKVKKPNNPTKEGYDFIEWQLNNTPYDFNSKVTSNMTLKAIWEEKSYKLTLLTNEPSCKVEYNFTSYKSGKVLSFKKGTEVRLYARKSEGYIFDEATSSDVEIEKNGSIGRIIIMPEKDVTITFNFKEEL